MTNSQTATVRDFLDHVGIEPLHTALRAIDKHNLEHVWIVVDGVRLYYHVEGLNDHRAEAIVTAVGAGVIGWDGTDWEYSNEVPVTKADIAAQVKFVRDDCIDAYDNHRAEADAEEMHNAMLTYDEEEERA